MNYIKGKIRNIIYQNEESERPDMSERIILKNVKIVTSHAAMPWAEAVSVRDGVFEAVGSNREIAPGHDVNPPRESSAKIIDLEGRTVLPGFIDSHTHVALSVMMDGEDDAMPMWDCRSKDEILSNLRRHVKEHPYRLYYAAFFGQVEALAGETLTCDDLDTIVKHRPVVLLEKECHSAWLNSGALRFMGLRDSTEDMAPGYSYCERDEKGRLTGCIKEMMMLPLLSMAGGVSKRDMKKGILRITDYLLDHGVTTIFDAGNYFREEWVYRLLSEMDCKGELPVRWEGSYIITSPEKADVAVRRLKRYRSRYEGDRLRFNTIKIMFDGTHRAHTAKLIEPYADTENGDAETTGGTMLSEDRLCREGASKMVLDCADRVREEQGSLDINITLAHLESQRDEDIPRFAGPGIFANFTPHWHGGSDYGTPEETARLLGRERAGRLLRAKAMVDSGAAVTFSSDEVTLQLLDRWNPFLGIEIGHTRQEITRGEKGGCGKGAPVFPPESERLTIEDLIRGYTINGAKQLRLEQQIGSIEPGKKADLMVLNRDIFSVSPYEIHDIMPDLVMMEGKVVRGSL